MLVIEQIEKKMKAVSEAQRAMLSVNSVRPGAFPESLFVTLAELKVDLMDAQDIQEGNA